MTTRTQRKTVVFSHPFWLKGVDRVLPPGDYEAVTDEELIDGLSFPVYHRVSTAIIAPAQSHPASSVEMVEIDPRDLQSAQDRDTAAKQSPAAKAKPVSGRSEDFDEGGPNKVHIGNDRQNDRPRPAPRDVRPESHRPSPANVEADQSALRLRQDELEAHLLAAPAANWRQAAEKARYLLTLFAATLTSQDPRRQKLIAAVLADFERLSGEP